MDPRLMIGPAGPQLGGVQGNLLNSLKKAKKSGQSFAGMLQNSLEKPSTQEIHISAHAQRRMNKRNIEMNSELKSTLNDAIDSLSKKGARDSLVVTDKGAFLVNVPNRTLVTAIGKDEMRDGIVTQIDSVSMKYS